MSKLTSSDIDTLSGPELDSLVAEFVMGETKPTETHRDHIDLVLHGHGWFCLPDYYRGDICEWEPQPYSTSWRMAGEIINYLLLDGYKFDCGIDDENFYARFHTADEKTVYVGWAYRGVPGEELAAAVCKAALKAVVANG